MLIQSFLIGFAFYNYSYYLPLYYQSARGMSLYTSATLYLPLVLTQATFSALGGQYMSRVQRYWELLAIGFALWTLGAGLNLLFTRTFSIVGIVFILMIQGVGLGFTFQPTLVAAQAHTRKEDRAVVISARNFVRAMGGAVGLAVASSIYSNTLKRNLPQSLPSAIRGEVLGSTFSQINLTPLRPADRTAVLNAYMAAINAVFIMWVSCIGICTFLMAFIKDKGLTRKGETEKPKGNPGSETVTPDASSEPKEKAEKPADEVPPGGTGTLEVAKEEPSKV